MSVENGDLDMEKQKIEEIKNKYLHLSSSLLNPISNSFEAKINGSTNSSNFPINSVTVSAN